LNPTEVVNPTDPKLRDPSTELAKPIPVEIVALVDIDQLAEAHKKFGEFKHRILTRDDWMVIQGRNFLKKSAWRKWALGCGVSDELVSLERIPSEGRTKDGEFQYRVISNAIHRPTGRSSIGVAAASNKEKPNWAHEEHDVLTLAHTRSKTRAISDLVGGGEVSAEEMTAEASERAEGSEEQKPIEPVEKGTSTGPESPVPVSPGPSQPTEIPVSKPEGSYRVPLANDFLPENKKPAGLLQLPLDHDLRWWGMLNQLQDEISIVPKEPLPYDPEKGPVHWFLEGTQGPPVKKGIVRPICEKWNSDPNHSRQLQYKPLHEGGFLKAIVITGDTLDFQHVKDLLNAAWAFHMILEPKEDQAQQRPVQDRSHVGSPLGR